MGKKSNMTGTGKKLLKQQQQETKKILRGEYAPTTDLKQMLADYKTAGKGAKKIFEPIQADAIRQFEQTTAPEVRGAYGAAAGQGSRSSALNQALAAARGNLQSELTANFSGLQNQLAQNITNQRYQNQTTGLQGRLQANGQQFQSPYQQQAQKQGNDWGSAVGGLAEGGGKAYLAWTLAKAAAAPATGGASLAMP